jgi:hypothetical protein
MDIDVNVNLDPKSRDFLVKSTTYLPITVIKVKNANRYSVDNKENQATAYAINVANCQFPALRKFGLLILTLTYHKSGSISLRLFYVFADMINEKKCIFWPLLFWSDNCTNDDLNFAFTIIFSFADVVSEHWKNNTSPDTSTPLSNNVIKIKNIIKKINPFSSA